MLQRLVSLFTTNERRRGPRVAGPARPALRLEVLEDRSLPAPLFTAVPVSDVAAGTNHIAEANSSRNVAVAPNGTIYVAFYGDSGIRVAHSNNRGHSFSPSVQVTEVSSEVDLAVGGGGVVYAGWVEEGQGGNDVMISRSTDGGATFSTPAFVGKVDANDTAVHLAAQATFVYVVPSRGFAPLTSSDVGKVVFVNNNQGVGAFTRVATGDRGTRHRAFADIQVNPATGAVYVQSDDPILRVFRSTNHGVSFTPVHLSQPTAAIGFSTMTVSFSPNGAFMFVSGAGTDAVRINLATGGTTVLVLTFGFDTSLGGRSLAADPFNVVDTFFQRGVIKYHVSHNNGASFGPTVTVAQAQSANVAINPRTRDIVIAYEQNGNIFVNVYAGELLIPTPPKPPPPPPTRGPIFGG
jgi:hypothetical protein